MMTRPDLIFEWLMEAIRMHEHAAHRAPLMTFVDFGQLTAFIYSLRRGRLGNWLSKTLSVQ
jgi:hypothetical protein